MDLFFYFNVFLSMFIFFFFFFFNDTATTEIYTLSLHDALPISFSRSTVLTRARSRRTALSLCAASSRSEEHTSELQSRGHLVCRLLLEKKKSPKTTTSATTTQRSNLS